MLRFKIKDVDDQNLTSLLHEIGFVCNVDPMDQPNMALFDFISYCFEKHDLKRRAKHLPTDGILNRKFGELRGTQVEVLLKSFCQLRGIVSEAYESKKLHNILTACAPQKTRRIRVAKLALKNNQMTRLIQQRRSNGDL